MNAIDEFNWTRGNLPAGCMCKATSWNGAAFVGGLVALKNPKHTIEIGCAGGTTSIYMARALCDLGLGGKLVCYDTDTAACQETMRRLEEVWPLGDWRVICGSFFDDPVYSGDPVDFAFLDIDPKGEYVNAFNRVKFNDKAICVSHDLTLQNEGRHVEAVGEIMRAQGWQVMGLPWERGFLVGMKA